MKKQTIWPVLLVGCAVLAFNSNMLAQVGTEGAILGVANVTRASR